MLAPDRSALLLPWLLVACAPAAATPPAPAPAVASTAPPPPAPTAVYVEPFAAIPRAEVLDGKAVGTEHQFERRYGRGAFSYRGFESYQRGPLGCPVVHDARRRDHGCGFFSLTSTGQTPADPLWPPAELPALPASLVPRGPVAAPYVWVSFAGGRDAIYALREGGKHIDRIDDQGNVSPFVSDERGTDWERLWVIEQGPRTLFAVGYRQRSPLLAWALGEASEGKPGEPRKLGPLTELPMRVLATSDYSPEFSPENVRRATDGRKLASLREPQFLALPDGRWAMVWLELALPPPSPNRPDLDVSLDDARISKRAHVTTFSGTSLVSDEVAWSTGDLGDVANFALAPRLEQGRVAVAPPSAARSGALPGPGPEDRRDLLVLPRGEKVIAAPFDPVSGEGLLVIEDNLRVFFRRFDAQGAPLGEPIMARQRASFRDLASTQGQWLTMGASREEPAFFNVSAGTGPFFLPRNEALGELVATPQGAQYVFLRARYPVMIALGADGVQGKQRALEAIPDDLGPLREIRFARLNEAAIMVMVATPQGAPQQIAWRALTPGAPWERLALPWPGVKDDDWRLRQLWGEVVVEVTHEQKRLLVWLGSKKQVEWPGPDPDVRSPQRAFRVLTGPLLGEGLRLTGAATLVDDPRLRDSEPYCPESIATGARSVVQVCSRPIDPFKPGVRVAIRGVQLGAGP